MSENVTKAILVVSFGTSHADTREKTIERIENAIAKAYPAYKVYRAWTSRIIMRILKQRDGMVIDNVEEAFAHMKADGIREVIVQPTHVINGIENDRMIEEADRHLDEFDSIRIGSPLLTSEEDQMEAVDVVAKEWIDVIGEDALVLMGHGTEHYVNSIYAALDYTFKDKGYHNIHLGTVEAYPSVDSVLKQVQESGVRKVHLAPFMIVAGDHAKNDLSGDDEDSWASIFKAAGFEVECHLKGLGEYTGVQQMLVRHVGEA